MIYTRIEESRHTIILIFFSILYITNSCAAQKDYCVFQDYRSRPPEEIAAAIRNDLASKDPSRRDRAVIFLSALINDGKKTQKNNQAVLILAGDKDVINIASIIIAEHLAGWYEERGDGALRSMPMYYPLFHLLALSTSKVAGMTLLMAMPVVGFDAFLRETVFLKGPVLKIAISKIPTIENKLCCFFPGKDPVCDMLAIDYRLTLLRTYFEAAENKGPGVLCNDAELSKFVFGCLQFGDGTKGWKIREIAVSIACILIKAGQNELLPAVQRIAESDPYYLYKVKSADNNALPQYDITSKYYPVREKVRKELSLQR